MSASLFTPWALFYGDDIHGSLGSRRSDTGKTLAFKFAFYVIFMITATDIILVRHGDILDFRLKNGCHTNANITD